MASFYTTVIRRDERFASAGRVADLDLLEPMTRRAVQEIVADADALGIALMVFETYRSTRRQRELARQGASQRRVLSVHHFGLACDLVRTVNGEPSWKGDFTFLGRLARRHGLIWGGDWGEPDRPHRFIDAVHVQRIRVGRQRALFARRWYPDATYEPWVE